MSQLLIEDRKPGTAEGWGDWILVFAAVIGGFFFVLLFAAVEPTTTIDLRLDRYDAWRMADQHLIESGFEVEDYTRINAAFVANNQLLAFFQESRLRSADTDEYLRHEPLAYWDLTYRNPSNRDEFRFKIDATGHIFECVRTPPAGLSPGRLDQSEAITRAQEHLTRQLGVAWADFEILEARTIQNDDRTDHLFTWERVPSPADGLHLEVFAKVQGDAVGGWGSSITLPPAFSIEYAGRSGRADLYELAQFIVAVTIWILAIFVFALRFRAQEVGIRNGIIVAIAMAAILGAFLINSLSFVRHAVTSQTESLQPVVAYFSIGVNVLFSGLGVFFVWISGESLARELWPEKLKVFDGLFSQHYLFKDLGRAILRGCSLALVELGIFYGVVWLAMRWGNAWAIIGEAPQELFSAYLPFASPLTLASVSALLATTYAFLFTLALLKRRVKRNWLAAGLTLVIFAPVFADSTILLDRWYTSMAGAVAGIAAYIYFFRYDLGTVFFGAILAALLPAALNLLYQPVAPFQFAGIASLAVIAALVVIAVVAVRRGGELDEQDIQPQYVQYISERERLKLELDIARRAQLRMLPRNIPITSGLDIAAFSEPAREVGGDYFDFFRLNPDRLGVAIGDVSGKGMPAALYMTMLKGFLQSQADSGAGPREILCSTNRYFYSSADTSTFITLLFCMFDLGTSELTFARAGHYPLLVHRPSDNATTILQPPGIGIGLEEGRIFERVIREERFALQKGDVIVMYTDGLTEARNISSEEFGQERIRSVLQHVHGWSSEEILTAIRALYENFRDGRDAHDDFSCVVTRVT